MRFILIASITLFNSVIASIPEISNSLSPNGKIHAVMDMDRDPTIPPQWKGDSYPKIEFTEKKTGEVLLSTSYFGGIGDSQRPIRENIEIKWRKDSKAFVINIHDRFYSYCRIYVMNEKSEFTNVPLPQNSYEKMTGYPEPNVKDLRPRGRNSVIGWDENNYLIYSIFRSPLPSYNGNDPLRHRILFEVTATKLIFKKNEHEKGKWVNGDWLKDEHP